MDVVISKNTLKSNKGYAVIGTDSSIKTYSGNTLKGNGHTDTIYAINTSLPYSVSSKKNKNQIKWKKIKKVVDTRSFIVL